MIDKQEKLKQAIIYFEQQDRGVQDYMELFSVVRYCLAQGDGLLWSHVREVLEEVIGEKK